MKEDSMKFQFEGIYYKKFFYVIYPIRFENIDIGNG